MPTHTATRSDPRQEFLAAFREAEARYGLPEGVLEKMAELESSFRPDVVSPAGAVGLMQIMPQFHPDVDPTDPFASIDYAGRYLSELRDRFGSLDLALAAYNAGPTNVRRYEGIPPFAETQNYVANILESLEASPETPVSRLDIELQGRMEDNLIRPDATRVNLADQIGEPQQDQQPSLLQEILGRMGTVPEGLQALLRGDTPADRSIEGFLESRDRANLPGPVRSLVEMAESPAAGIVGSVIGPSGPARSFIGLRESLSSPTSPVGRTFNPRDLPSEVAKEEIARLQSGFRSVEVGNVRAEQFTNVLKAPHYQRDATRVDWGAGAKMAPNRNALNEWGSQAFAGGSDITISVANRLPKPIGIQLRDQQSLWYYQTRSGGIIGRPSHVRPDSHDNQISFIHEYGHHLDAQLYHMLRDRGFSNIPRADERFASASIEHGRTFREAVNTAAARLGEVERANQPLRTDLIRLRTRISDRIIDSVFDVFGSITYHMGGRRAGWGHSLDYYKVNPNAMYSEPFANMFQLHHYSTADTFTGQAARRGLRTIRKWAPEVSDAFEELLALALKLK